jgi:hypothetical protein
MTDKPLTGRLRTATDPRKAFRQYDELRRTGRLKEALIVAETKDGHFHVLAQMTNPAGAARLCMVAAEALAQVPEDKRGPAPVESTPPPPPPVRPAVKAGGKPVHSIAAGWTLFEQNVFSPEIGPVQRREMRRAFYCGAQELFSTIMAMLDPGEEATDADLSRMTDLNDELERFVEDMKEGRA